MHVRPTAGRALRRLLQSFFALALAGGLLPAPPSHAETAVELRRDERTVYVPYEKLDQVFGKEHRAVLMPYEDFLKLWGAIPDDPEEDDPPPPVEATASTARYAGRISGDVALFEATIEVAALAKRWARVLLPIEGLTVTHASLDGRPPMMSRSAGGLELVLPERGSYTLELGLAAPVTGEAGTRELTLAVPPVPVSELTIELGEDLEVEARGGAVTALGDGRYRVLPEGAGAVTLSWSPKVREGDARGVLLARSGALVTVGETDVRNRTTLDLEVRSGAPSRFRVALPAGATLVDASGPSLRGFRVDPAAGDGAPVLVLESFEPVRESFRVTLELEARRAASETRASVPLVQALGVTRERGWVAVAHDPGLRVVPVAGERLSRIAPGEVPADLVPRTGPEPVAAYRYLDAPEGLAVEVARLEPTVDVDALTSLDIGEEWIDARYALDYRVRDAGIFRAGFALPDGLEVLEVGPAALVDTFRVTDGPDGTRRLEVELRSMVLGNARLTVEGRLRRASPEAPVSLPLLDLEATRETGWVGISAVDRFKLHTVSSQGLLPVPVPELRGGAPAAPELLPRPPSLAFRYTARPVALEVGVELRKTRVTAEVVNRLDVDTDLTRVRARVRWSILYAGVDAVSFRVPAAIGERIAIEGPNVKEKRIAARDDEHVVWRVELMQRTLGDQDLTVSYDLPVANGEQDGARAVELARLEVVGVDREQGYVTVTKGPNLEVAAPVTEGLEPIDPEELPADARDARVFLAFKYVQPPYALGLEVKRHELAEILNLIVNRAWLRTVVAEEHVATSELVLELQANQRQYLELALPESSQVMSVLVAGQPERPSLRESDGVTLIPLARAGDSAASFVVRIAYETQHPRHFWNALLGRLVLDAPEVPGVPVQKFAWDLWLPRGNRYLEPRGDLRRVSSPDAGWDRLKRGASFLTDIGPGSAPPVMRTDPRQAPPPASGGLTVELVEEGVHLSLGRLGGTGRVRVGYLDRALATLLDLALFLGTLWWGIARAPSRRRFALAAGAAALLGLAVTTGYAASLLASVLGGALVLGLTALPGWLREARAHTAGTDGSAA